MTDFAESEAAVTVELRMWKSGGGLRRGVIPVAVPALFVRERGEPKLLVDDDDGDTVCLTTAEMRQDCYGSLHLLSEPGEEQSRLLAEAAAIGYAVEPRLAGQTFLPLKRL